MTETIDAATQDRALKARHRAMWALGDYPTVASEVIPELGPVLVTATGVRGGDRVLDVAAGSGNAAVPAAPLAPPSWPRTSPPSCSWPAERSRRPTAST